MPVYEYHCKDCGFYFEVRASIKQKEEGLKLNCEKCGGNNLLQVFGGFAILGRQTLDVKKDRATSGSGSCCRGGTSCFSS